MKTIYSAYWGLQNHNYNKKSFEGFFYLLQITFRMSKEKKNIKH